MGKRLGTGVIEANIHTHVQFRDDNKNIHRANVQNVLPAIESVEIQIHFALPMHDQQRAL